jgi:predicted CXXCH cytochrome family protein
MEKGSLKRRLGQRSRASLIFLLVASALVMSKATGLSGEDMIEHPFIERKDIKPETCLTCHPEKKGAKFVHTALEMGCTNCHRVTSENNKTTITLRATGGDLCAICHAGKKDAVLHGPYAAGQCLVCHDPHTGDYPAQTRAEINTLCLSCHGTGQSSVKANPETQLVMLLGNQIVSLNDYRQAPKLELDRGGTSGHPVKGHPLTGKDPRKKDGTLNCLSCHDPHSSALPNLMPAGVKSQTDLCAQCHK